MPLTFYWNLPCQGSSRLPNICLLVHILSDHLLHWPPLCTATGDFLLSISSPVYFFTFSFLEFTSFLPCSEMWIDPQTRSSPSPFLNPHFLHFSFHPFARLHSSLLQILTLDLSSLLGLINSNLCLLPSCHFQQSITNIELNFPPNMSEFAFTLLFDFDNNY